MKPRLPNSFLLSLLFCLSLTLLFSCLSGPVQKRHAERLYYEGQAHLSQGNTAEAVKKFEYSLQLAEKAGFRAGVAHNLNELAIIYTTRGEYKKARDALTATVPIYKELGMNPEVSKALNNIALTYLREHRFREAVSHYENLLKWDQETGNRLGEAIALNQMGWIHANFLKEPKRAYPLYAKAREIFEELGKDSHVQVVEKNIESILKQKQSP